MAPKKNILIIPGDGIGKEVTAVGKAVLEQILIDAEHEYSFDEGSMGHTAIEETGDPLPEETLNKAKASDAILFGAVGHLKYDNDPKLTVRPEGGLLRLRKGLGLYANLRPITVFDELVDVSNIKPEVIKGTDILFFRELTGDAYFGEKQRNENMASDLMIYHRYEVERIGVMAFEAARKRKKKLCSVDKANVLESSRLWREVMQDVAKKYPDIETTHMLADNAAMQLIKNPRQFDVIVTTNVFGDILTDEASQIAGSMGMLASASIGSGIGFYEPIHGSAHDIAGQNKANPLASILSVAMMLEISFDMKEESNILINAIRLLLKNGYRTADIAGPLADRGKILGTKEMGLKVIEYLKQSRVNQSHMLVTEGLDRMQELLSKK